MLFSTYQPGEQDTLISTATKGLSEQRLAKSLKAAAQNQLKHIS